MPAPPDVEETFERLMVSHQAALHAFVLSLMPGHAESDDVVQEVNAALWQKRGEFAAGANFKAWMFAVARFKVMALWPRPEAAQGMERAGGDAESADRGCDGGVLHSEDQRHLALRQCIRELRPQDQGLVLRRYFDGHSMEEVAREVGRKAENLKGSQPGIGGPRREKALVQRWPAGFPGILAAAE